MSPRTRVLCWFWFYVCMRTTILHPRIHRAVQPVQQLRPETTSVTRVVVIVVSRGVGVNKTQHLQYTAIVETIAQVCFVRAE